ncbi:hypothetical protein BS50DRAFT_580026 [Corynespora cassiicola Philippines]|uniref:Clavaminate synthase-like protein n=1 Tax=Corynespora cassiicola Philippines TaxID=1448308 RepID=A0A2T2N1X7_CORCC|nr:hypothetical protein BS50DRAFT_580026 [Corynespora cassiicola Philippines]
MAALAPAQPTHHFSVSNLISRFRTKRRRPTASGSKGVYQDPRPSLKPSPLPLVLPEHHRALSNLGWTTLTFPSTQAPLPPSHPLQTAYQDLFAAAQQFFDQPDASKQQWKHKLKSEEGWSKIPGEKEFITLRTLSYTPHVLKAPAKRYWDLMGAHLGTTLDRMSTSLDLSSGESAGLRKFVGPCATMQEDDANKTATMLRLFRYEGWGEKVVAEAHADLGLLSVVVGDVPGLEVWDGSHFFDVERRYKSPAATMLVGRQLEMFSNGRYVAGGHRVVSYPRPQPHAQPSHTEKKYRHSIVFVLRAHEPILVRSSELESAITGKWTEPVDAASAGKIYEEIRARHFNINIDKKERDDQRLKLEDGSLERK